MNILFGCAGLRGAIDNYAKRFEIVEVDPIEATPKTKTATLRRWRKDAGPTLAFSVVAPKAVAALRPGPALDEGLAALLEAQAALQARWVLLTTPIEVTPAPLWRERLGKIVERIREGLGDARDVVHVAWAPRGLWEMADAAELAKQLKIELAADPLLDPREPFWHERMRYLRIGAVGGRTAYPPARIRMLAEALVADSESGGDRAIVFTTPKAPVEVKRLKSLVGALQKSEGEAGEFVPHRRGAAASRSDEEE
jgi:uncharacterized protein YecE (DUF72 family)